MKMSKKYKRLCLTFGLGTALCATVANAANYTKTLNATYRNIGVTYNGTEKTLSAEPFLVDGSTYVPLRAVSEIMGANVNWNGSTNTVTITNDTADNTLMQQQLATANYQIATLQRDLNAAKAELETYKSSNNSNSSSSATSGTNITTAEIEATEKYLSDHYADYLSDDIYLDFDLVKKSSRLQLTISYSDRNEEKTFNNLRESKVTEKLKDICADIAARHANIEIQGVVNYTKSDLDKVTFTYSKTGRFSATYGLDEELVQEIVEANCSKVLVQGVGYVSVRDVDVKVNNSNSTVTYTIYIDGSASNFAQSWDNDENRVQTSNALQNTLNTVSRKISNETDYSIMAEIYTYNSGTYLGYYDYSNSSITLKKISK